jgi:hypothetical protein
MLPSQTAQHMASSKTVPHRNASLGDDAAENSSASAKSLYYSTIEVAASGFSVSALNGLSSQFQGTGSAAKGRVGDFSVPLEHRQALAMQECFAMMASPAGTPGVPEKVRNFHSFVILSGLRGNGSKSIGVRTTVFKAMNTDGSVSCLVKVDATRLALDIKQVKETWSEIRHPSIAYLREVFISNEFPCDSGGPASNSVICCYEFIPNVGNLNHHHIAADGPLQPISRSLFWFYASQLTAAVRVVHSNSRPNVALRNIHPTKVMVDSYNRVWITHCGIFDLVHASQPDAQVQDVVDLGRLMLSLCCQSYELFSGMQSTSAVDLQMRISQSLEYVASHFGSEVAQFIDSLLNPGLFGPSQQSPIFAVSAKFSSRLLTATDILLARLVSSYCFVIALASVVTSFRNGCLERELAQEYESGRMLRYAQHYCLLMSTPSHFKPQQLLQFDVKNSFRE